MSNADSADAPSGLLDFTFGPGSVVADRYKLVRKIGSGGMGSVWLAEDQSLDAPCAVKLVADDKVTNDEIRARFAREAKSSAQLRSPHVVHVFDYGESDGALYIAMEWLEGEDLSVRLDRVGVLDPSSTYRVIAHVSRALMSAHSMGIVHRDLKPENIFLVQSYDEETAKVLDFGIARHSVYSLHDQATRTGSFLGTPFYVSPEQARGKPIDHRADLWSLGVIAFQCLTGRPPFESDALGELMGLILYEPLPVPSALNRALPPAVDDWWQRAAARDREQRFQSAKELTDELAAALGLQPFVTVPPPARRRTSEFPAEADGSGIFKFYPADQPRADFLMDPATLTGLERRPPEAKVGDSLTEVDDQVLVSRFRRPKWLSLALVQGRALASRWGRLGRLKWPVAALPVLVVLAGLVLLFAGGEEPVPVAPATGQQTPTKIVVATPDPGTRRSESAPPPQTGINPESLPIEPPEAARRATPPPVRRPPPQRVPPKPQEEPEPARPDYGI